MEALDQLKDFKKILDKELEIFLRVKINEAEKVSPTAKELVEHIADLTLRGGKRIRPALLYYSFLAHDGKDGKDILRAAMAIEMSEAYLLIHDDIMDDNTLRRGGTTIHHSYQKSFENSFPDWDNPRHFGISMGILAGDIACALSNELIATANFQPEYKTRALAELNKVYATEGYGQAMEIMASVENSVSKKEVSFIHQLKTVPYTFDGPVKIGAILAGTNEKDLAKLSQYTMPLGAAYQIQDDILCMFGSEEKLGKPVTSDLKEGKKTLLILDALEKATPKQKEIIELNLGNKKVTIAGLNSVRKVIEETGSLAESKKLATSLVQKAIDALDQMNLKKEGKDFLLGIAKYMVKREY